MNNLLNHQISASTWNQSQHQAALEYPASSTVLFSQLQPITNLSTNLSEYSASLYRAETSTTADLRSPSSTSGEVQLIGEHNSIAFTQGHLEEGSLSQKLVPVPLALRRGNEDDNTRITPAKLSKRKYNMKLVSVPSEHRLPHEDEHTRINIRALSERKHKKKLVPVPSEYRLPHEDEHTRISFSVLFNRKRNGKFVSVPPEYRLPHEDEHTQITCHALLKRKHDRELVAVPLEYRRRNEDEHTKIRRNALNIRKNRKLKSAALSGEKPHAPHQAAETSEANTLTDSMTDTNSARQNSPILTRS
ncbi:MAG: hypothetical protein P8144_14585, partial [Gammaproteobacteria bacterium]